MALEAGGRAVVERYLCGADGLEAAPVPGPRIRGFCLSLVILGSVSPSSLRLAGSADRDRYGPEKKSKRWSFRQGPGLRGCVGRLVVRG